MDVHSFSRPDTIRVRHLDLDLRVDDHVDPLTELARLEEVSRERWVYYRKFLPRAGNPVGETDREVINAGIEAGIAAARGE